jgi:hypothetical protein
MAEHRWTPEELQALAALGLSITPHSDPSYGWGYTWQNRDWAGPFTSPSAAIDAAFTEAMHALQFMSDYSWVLFAQPGERWQFTGDIYGWEQIEELQSKPRRGIDAVDAEAQARQDWSNDE